MTTCRFFFFYGTLMAGERNAGQLDGVRIVSRRPARVRGLLIDCGRYPALLLPAPDDDRRVVGELVEFHDDDVAALCARLDPFEGYVGPDHPQNLYERRRVVVTVDVTIDCSTDGSTDGEEDPEAWVYVRPTPPSPADDAVVIVDGDWREHRRRLLPPSGPP